MNKEQVSAVLLLATFALLLFTGCYAQSGNAVGALKMTAGFMTTGLLTLVVSLGCAAFFIWVEWL